MWERFTESSKHVIDETRREAGRLGSDFVRDYHLMLGICRVREAIAARALKNLNVEVDVLSHEIEQHSPHGRAAVDGYKLNWTLSAKNVLGQAVVEARNFNHDYIGTEHILLGLIAYDASEYQPGFLVRLFDRCTVGKIVIDHMNTNWHTMLPVHEAARREVERLLGESGRDPA